MSQVPDLEFADGNTIPQLGLGVYKASDIETKLAVSTALETGYRQVDTASFYANEAAVGQAILDSDVARAEVFVTSKVWQTDQGFAETKAALRTSLDLLGFDYLDLYLIHWPAPIRDRYVETWRALIELKAEGLVRSIGVSNFHTHHVDRLIAETGVAPVINQVELHPWLQQNQVIAYDDAHNIVTQSWAPLARGKILDEPLLAELATRYDRSPAQIVIRWHLQRGIVVIPKSVTPERIRSNFEVFDFTLSDNDLARIAALDSGLRTGRDPDFAE